MPITKLYANGQETMEEENTMLDDLRQAAAEQDNDGGYESALAGLDEDRLFGMTAIERMFVAIGIFGITVIISMILLIASSSIELGG